MENSLFAFLIIKSEIFVETNPATEKVIHISMVLFHVNHQRKPLIQV